jgi:transcription elongation GreA/GreB family factor
MSDEKVEMGTDVSFKVRRAGEVIEERRVIRDVEVDPELARLIEENPLLVQLIEMLLEQIEKKEE